MHDTPESPYSLNFVKGLKKQNMSKIWPNFFIVGAAKAGTTSLYKYLSQHYQIFMSPVKEPGFFAPQKRIGSVIKSEEDYLSLFSPAQGSKAIGEASPRYFWDKEAAYRIKTKIPRAKIIMLLRDPIDRAYSQYLFDLRLGLESKPFWDALGGENAFAYLEPGRYFTHTERYIDVFGQDNNLVLLFEDLKREPYELLREVAEFLDVDREYVQNINVHTVYNPYQTPDSRYWFVILKCPAPIRNIFRRLIPGRIRNQLYKTVFVNRMEKPSMDPKAHKYLKDFYTEEMVSLEKLLGVHMDDLRKVW